MTKLLAACFAASSILVVPTGAAASITDPADSCYRAFDCIWMDGRWYCSNPQIYALCVSLEP